MWCSVNALFVLCVACLTVFGETIRKMFGCGCYFVIECYESVYYGWGCSVGQTVFGLPKNACCDCDPSVHLSVPSIGFVYVFVFRKLSSHLKV